MNIIGWIVFGLVVGAIARFLLPGRQSMGWIATMILGVIGSFAGGTIGSLLFGDGGSGIQPGSWISSILGALLVLFLYAKFAQKA
ncbi:MAG: GlsB/YeaQ/YmgE family stress response membrane protein [Planctomycetaceae bacterium]|nr:GlsB/YeaQ/YmgE family stress response membrane protein [Planctomycetaceae bacterium]